MHQKIKILIKTQKYIVLFEANPYIDFNPYFLRSIILTRTNLIILILYYSKTPNYRWLEKTLCKRESKCVSVSRSYKQSTYQSNTSQAVRAPPRRIPMHPGRLGSRTYRKAGYRIRRHPGNVYLSGGQTSDRQRAEARLWNPGANGRCRYSWQPGWHVCAKYKSN